jgi:hypothetical protein
MLSVLEDFINKNSMMIAERRKTPGRKRSLKLEATLTRMDNLSRTLLRFTVPKDSK